MTDTRTGLAWHEKTMWHEGGRIAGIMPAEYPVEPGLPHETAAAKKRLKNLCDASGMTDKLVPIAAREASEAELLRVHTPAYLAKLAEFNLLPQANAGLDGFMTRGSFDIARLAAGCVLSAVDALFAGEVDNAYALVRPVGHHATADAGMGFCLLANPSLAAAHARAVHGARRVAIIDVDVHHGNGAQSIFWRDPNVLTLSVHQEDWFPPASGGLDERGEGEGFGANLNIPLPAGCGWGAYSLAFERVILPALARFRPDFVIMPCGYDAGAQDQLGRMILHGGAYAQMTRMLMDVAAASANGRLLVTHEGGYNPWTVPFMGLKVIETLRGCSSGVVDPHEEIFAHMTGHALLPHQEAAVDRAARLVADVPAG